MNFFSQFFNFLEHINIFPIIDILQVVLFFFSAFIIITRVVYNSMYKYEMANYYKIPEKYFETDIFTTIGEFAIYIISIVFIILVLYILEIKFKDNFIIIGFECLFLYFSLFGLLEHITRNYKHNLKQNNMKKSLLFFNILLIFAPIVWLFSLISLIYYKNNNLLLIIISIILFFYFYYCQFLSAKYKFNYKDKCEFTKLENKDFIIVDHYKDCVLLQEILYINEEKNTIKINKEYFKIQNLQGLNIYIKNDISVND